MPPPFANFHLPPELTGHALAAVLRVARPGISWNDAKRLIQQRRIQVNGNLSLDPAQRLKAGDVIKIWDTAQAKPVSEADVRIRHIDSQIVIVEKPPGITTQRHPDERRAPGKREQHQPTLDEVVTKLTARGQRGGRPVPVRPVHRLDRDTSGLMVFARTREAADHLVKQFRRHSIRRSYFAVVHGAIDEPFMIVSNLVRDRGDGLRGSADNEQVGRRAVTHVEPVERLGDYSLIRCRLETGRTHQIRIHLAEQGHVVCGDRVYHASDAKGRQKFVDRSGAPRQALHAAELAIDHPLTGERLEFESPLSSDMLELLTRLRARVHHEPEA